MRADYSFYVKTIETHACSFLALNTLAIGSVSSFHQSFHFNSCTQVLFFLLSFIQSSQYIRPKVTANPSNLHLDWSELAVLFIGQIVNVQIFWMIPTS